MKTKDFKVSIFYGPVNHSRQQNMSLPKYTYTQPHKYIFEDM